MHTRVQNGFFTRMRMILPTLYYISRAITSQIISKATSGLLSYHTRTSNLNRSYCTGKPRGDLILLPNRVVPRSSLLFSRRQTRICTDDLSAVGITPLGAHRSRHQLSSPLAQFDIIFRPPPRIVN